jgi:pentatricopeptide repeat protein
MALEEGRQAHQLITQSGCELDVFVRNRLIDMYAKCGSMEDASRMFNKMASHNVVTWTACLMDMPCMGVVRKLFNILSVCVKKVWR